MVSVGFGLIQLVSVDFGWFRLVLVSVGCCRCRSASLSPFLVSALFLVRVYVGNFHDGRFVRFSGGNFIIFLVGRSWPWVD